VINALVADPLEKTEIIEMQETAPSSFAQLVPEPPTVGETPNKLSIYFVLNGGEVSAQADASPDDPPVDNSSAFIEVSMNFISEKPGEIHDLLRQCVGVIVQTQHSNGETKVTPLAVSTGG
jgi:hypothetical protein